MKKLGTSHTYTKSYVQREASVSEPSCVFGVTPVIVHGTFVPSLAPGFVDRFLLFSAIFSV